MVTRSPSLSPRGRRGAQQNVDQLVRALLEERLLEAHGGGQPGENIPVRAAFPHRRDHRNARCTQ